MAKTLLYNFHAKAQRTVSCYQVLHFLHALSYFHDEKNIKGESGFLIIHGSTFGSSLRSPRVLPSVLWRDDIFGKIHCNYLVSVHKVGYFVSNYKFKELLIIKTTEFHGGNDSFHTKTPCYYLRSLAVFSVVSFFYSFQIMNCCYFIDRLYLDFTEY
jgi:hypothetical protein